MTSRRSIERASACLWNSDANTACFKHATMHRITIVAKQFVFSVLLDGKIWVKLYVVVFFSALILLASSLLKSAGAKHKVGQILNGSIL